MTSAKTTIAQQISARLDDDGQKFVTKDGTSIYELCELAAEHRCCREEREGNTRWVFKDGSAIVYNNMAWDFGFQDCWCMESDTRDGHYPDKCTALIEKAARQ